MQKLGPSRTARNELSCLTLDLASFSAPLMSAVKNLTVTSDPNLSMDVCQARRRSTLTDPAWGSTLDESVLKEKPGLFKNTGSPIERPERRKGLEKQRLRERKGWTKKRTERVGRVESLWSSSALSGSGSFFAFFYTLMSPVEILQLLHLQIPTNCPPLTLLPSTRTLLATDCRD